MSNTHSNISIFVPHIGCSNMCSFCNQRHITGKKSAPKIQDVIDSVNIAVKSGHIIELDAVNVFYKEKKASLFGPVGRKHAVKDVTLHVREGEILGIVGESGSGKSSLAKAIVGLQAQVEGEIRLGTGTPQMVFQDPYGSLNPSKRIGWLLQEPLRLASPEMTEEEREKIFWKNTAELFGEGF